MTFEDLNFSSKFEKLAKEAKIMLEAHSIAQSIFDSARAKLKAADQKLNRKKEEIRSLVNEKAGMRIYL